MRLSVVEMPSHKIRAAFPFAANQTSLIDADDSSYTQKAAFKLLTTDLFRCTSTFQGLPRN
jgi:hypothetical protein